MLINTMKQSKDNKAFVDHFVALIRERAALIEEGNWLINTYRPKMDALRKKYGKSGKSV